MSDPLVQTVRGMQDFLPDRTPLMARIEDRARSVFALFGYGEIRTPVLESSALFERALGQATDIVEKEMFTLKDRGERVLCLRPEGTAGVARSYIENSLGKKSAVNKLFYVGPMFRAERPQAGRFRQFFQIGSEYFGNPAPSADAETIRLVAQIMRSVGVAGFEVQINSLGDGECRPKYQALLLDFLRSRASELCEDCRRRMDKNPLRALDCKTDRDKLLKAPGPLDSLCENCRGHHAAVKQFLQASGTPFKEAPQMVRGLDYYTRTVFEVYATGRTGSQDALAAGGRYDGLVEDLGGEKTPAVGFAMGLERVMNLLAPEAAPARNGARQGGVFVAALGKASLETGFQVLHRLRDGGLAADAVLNEQSLKSQMRLADSLGMRFCVIIGENEIKENKAAVKDLSTQTQEQVPMAGLVEFLKGKLSA